jgi:hypothetical protein
MGGEFAPSGTEVFLHFFRLPEFSGEITCEKNEEYAQGGIDLMPSPRLNP